MSDTDDAPTPLITWTVQAKGLLTDRHYTYTVQAPADAYAGDVFRLGEQEHRAAQARGEVFEPFGTWGTATRSD